MSVYPMYQLLPAHLRQRGNGFRWVGLFVRIGRRRIGIRLRRYV